MLPSWLWCFLVTCLCFIVSMSMWFCKRPVYQKASAAAAAAVSAIIATNVMTTTTTLLLLQWVTDQIYAKILVTLRSWHLAAGTAQ